MTTMIPYKAASASTLARGGVMGDLFTGRRVEVLSGYDADPSKKRGYTRSFSSSGHTYRPGANSPRTTRVMVSGLAPSVAGSVNVIGGIEALKERNLRFGVAGSRAPYAQHAPTKAGLTGTVPMINTPAYRILETAYARTGIPVIHSKFTSLAHEVPAGQQAVNFDGIPAYTHVPLSGYVDQPAPIGCLPGTPGCYAGADPGFRLPWSRTQNDGQRTMSYFDLNDSPIAGAHTDSGPITFPISHPGNQHVIGTNGRSSYSAEPGYPNYSSPFGYSGSGTRPAAQQVPASGHDDAFRKRKRNENSGRSAMKMLAIGAALYFGYSLVKARA